MSEKPVIIIHVEGGVVQDVFVPSGMDPTIVLLDYDTEGTEENDLTRTEEGDEAFMGLIAPTIHADLYDGPRKLIRKFCEDMALPCPV